MNIALSAILFATGGLSLVLAVHLARLKSSARNANRLLGCVFGLLGTQSSLLATYLLTELQALVVLRALIALVLIPAIFLFFLAMRRGAVLGFRSIRVHALPFLAGAGVTLLGMFGLIDAILMTTQLVYLVALMRIVLDRNEPFEVAEEHAPSLRHWLKVVTGFLAVSLALDIAITLGMARGESLAQSQSLAIASLSLALFVAYTMLGALGRPSLFEALYQFADDQLQSPAVPANGTDPARSELAERAVRELRQTGVFDNPAMTVLRLARRLGVPARQVSAAINAEMGCTFSDLLNDIRVDHAREVLENEGELGVLDAMLRSGYASRSNFYKQFSRRTGMTPGACLQAHKRRAAKVSGVRPDGRSARPEP